MRYVTSTFTKLLYSSPDARSVSLPDGAVSGWSQAASGYGDEDQHRVVKLFKHRYLPHGTPGRRRLSLDYRYCAQQIDEMSSTYCLGHTHHLVPPHLCRHVSSCERCLWLQSSQSRTGHRILWSRGDQPSQQGKPIGGEEHTVTKE